MEVARAAHVQVEPHAHLAAGFLRGARHFLEYTDDAVRARVQQAEFSGGSCEREPVGRSLHQLASADLGLQLVRGTIHLEVNAPDRIAPVAEAHHILPLVADQACAIDEVTASEQRGARLLSHAECADGDEEGACQRAFHGRAVRVLKVCAGVDREPLTGTRSRSLPIGSATFAGRPSR